MNTWAKLEDGSWGVKIEDPTDHAEHMVGFPVTVTKRSGERSHVVLGALVSKWMPKGKRGRWVYVFAVDDEGTAKIANDWATQDASFNARMRRRAS